MTVLKRNIRGLQCIRTLSGRVDQQFVPYKAYMKLTYLEMEKHRRRQERDNAMRLVGDIDARLREIDAEETMVLEALGVRQPSHQAASRAADVKPIPPRGAGSLRFRY